VKNGAPGIRWYYVLLAAIVICVAVYAVVCAIAPSKEGDDVSYSFYAHDAANGIFVQSPGDVNSLRILNILPIAFFYTLFGVSMQSGAAWSALSFAMTVLITFFIGRELYDERVGILAAFLIGIFPIVAIYADTMSDNPPLMMLMSLAILGYIYGKNRESRLWYAVCGLSVAAMIFVTPLGFTMWILILIFFAVEMVRGALRMNRKNLYVFYGFIIAMAIFCAYNYVNSGYPFITFSSNYNYFGDTSRPDLTLQPLVQTLDFYPQVIFPPVFNILQDKVGLMFYAFVIAALYLIGRKDGRAYIPLFWGIVGLAVLEFGPMHIGVSPFSYVLSHRLDRYVISVAPAVAIVVAAALVEFSHSPKKRQVFRAAACCFFIIIITVTSLYTIKTGYQFNFALVNNQMQVARYLNTLPNNTKIYIYGGSGEVTAYMKFNNISRTYVDYGGIEDCHEFPGGAYVVIPNHASVGFNYTPDPIATCSYWRMVLSPQVSSSIPEFISSTVANLNTEVNVYYVPMNNTTYLPGN
jgi:hypothetical protein